MPHDGYVLALGHDDERYAAVASRDPRFDGWFFTAVTSTRIYCRPSCPAITPKRANVRFYATAAAAQAAGFRACKRCRPDTTPGSPEWDVRADAVGRAMRLIADGVVEREGVAGLAARVGYSERHLHRILLAELGAGPQALARAQRAQTARILVETTSLSFANVAFAAGFASIRQFNETIRSVFAMTPTEMRGRGAPRAEAGVISLRLPVRLPYASGAMLRFLGDHAVPGVEALDAGTFRRSLQLARGTGIVDLTPTSSYVAAVMRLTDLRDLTAAVARCRRMLDADADPRAIDEHLARDAALAPLVTAQPGLRVPGATDGGELAIRAVLGQQISVTAARTLAGRVAALAGRPVAAATGGVSRLFPSMDVLAGLDPAALPMPRARADAVVALASAVASGRVTLDEGADRAEAVRLLQEVPGIGEWTATYVAMRALRDPDVFLVRDAGIRRGLAQLGLRDVDAARWRPWRSYASMHLWSAA